MFVYRQEAAKVSEKNNEIRFRIDRGISGESRIKSSKFHLELGGAGRYWLYTTLLADEVTLLTTR